MATVESRIKVAVIGAGAAGMCAARHLSSEPGVFSCDVFEQQGHVGGIWRYSSRVGKNEDGLPVYSSIYKSLRTNLVKEIMAFLDFPFPEIEGSSFVHHSEVLKYLEDYANHFEVHKHIKFHTLVENVRPLKSDDGKIEWAVTYCDVTLKVKETQVYDAVMICNGHYSVPRIPEIKGMSDFGGILLHSRDYRVPEPFKDLKVVILGCKASGLDISIEVAKFAKEVKLSHNYPELKCSLGPNIRQVPGIDVIGASSVTFKNGESYQCDAIILCTGYLYDYPFLDKTCDVTISDQRVSPLYMHMFHVKYPTLAFLSIPKLILPFPIYDQQVKVFLKFLKGSVQLPTESEMHEHTEKEFSEKLAQGYRHRDAHLMKGELQWKFEGDLCELGRITRIPKVMSAIFQRSYQLVFEDFLNYRNHHFRLVDDETFEQID